MMNIIKRTPNWSNILFLTLTPLASLIGGILYVRASGVQPIDLALFGVFYILTGLSITGGYHRYYSHRAYDCSKIVQFFYLCFGAAALENSVLRWASDHRYHHQYTDQPQDPYNIKEGFWHAHIGWIFFQSTKDREFTNMDDFKKDPLVLWQDRYYVPIALVTGFGLPMLIGAMFGRPWGGLLWGGLIRVVFVHHMTFFINSLAHIFGTQPYSDENSSRDSWWLAFLTYGEGYHNYHHRFQADYRNGIKWYQFDPTKWLIRSLERFNMASGLRRTPNPTIFRARLDMDQKQLEVHLHHVPDLDKNSMRHHLSQARIKIDHALTHLAEARARYREHLENRSHKSTEGMAWRQQMKEYEKRFNEARDHWMQLIQAYHYGSFTNSPT